MAFVYLIKSEKAKDWIYVGSTSNVEFRLKQHNSGQVRSTKFRRPYVLIYKEEYTTLKEARLREKQIKSSRGLKEKLIQLALSSNG